MHEVIHNLQPRISGGRTARVGLYTVGLKAYWGQFDGLKQRLRSYGAFIEKRMCAWGEVRNFGLVDDERTARKAGEYFAAQNVDIVFCHSATYCTSACVLPVHQLCAAPVVILSLQPVAAMNYAQTDTAAWLAHCVSCPVPEFVNALARARIPFKMVHGLLGLDKDSADGRVDEKTAHRSEAIEAWHEIETWVRAAGVCRTLRHARFGFLGNTYSGMLDLYSDCTLLQTQVGIHIENLEMCDLHRFFSVVTRREIEEKLQNILDFFEVAGDSPSDSIAKKPTEEQLEFCARVACAQEKFVHEHGLDALSYYYHGRENEYEKLQSGFIVGHSLLTAQGVPCAGEGDLKTAIAMKMCDCLDAGGSFSEIVAIDYERSTIIVGHDGPFHIRIAKDKPVLRGMGVYHGKRGSGVSVEAHVREGEITAVGVTQTGAGNLRIILCEGTAVDAPALAIGNTQTHVDFQEAPAQYMQRWFSHAPTHHFAIATGHQAQVFKKIGYLQNIEVVVV